MRGVIDAAEVACASGATLIHIPTAKYHEDLKTVAPERLIYATCVSKYDIE